MAKAINDDICIKGDTLIIGVKFPPVDDKYSLTDLNNSGALTVKYYIINTSNKYKATLYKIEGMDENTIAFTVNTSKLIPGVLMVECVATIPAHDGIPNRTETARCSSGIAIID